MGSSVWFLIWLVSSVAASNNDEDDYQSIHQFTNALGGHSTQIDQCVSTPLTGVEWILSQRGDDYGWGPHTHRALVALVLNDFNHLGSEETMLMEHQLEVELTHALLRNETEQMYLNDMALYIHALLATKREPCNFYKVDLVEALRVRVNQAPSVHPFALLALCNARAIVADDLNRARVLLRPHSEHPSRHNTELQALALKAFACSTDEGDFQQFANEINSSAGALARNQKPDGGFGNVYTTALVMQALIAAKHNHRWDEQAARDFLLSRRADNINMISTYYIEMALNAHKIKFLKDLKKSEPHTPPEKFPSVPELRRWPRKHYIQYTLKVGDYPEVYHTVTIKVPSNATFFDVMRLVAYEDNKFNFSYHLDPSGNPVVFALSGIPNDAEDNLYWRLVQETDVDHDRHRSRLQEITRSPATVTPARDSHYIYWHIDSFAPIRGINA